MNRKQKKAKRLNATAHTKKQATVYLTQKETDELFEWENYCIREAELEGISEECNRFKNIVKTVLILIPLFSVGYLVWCNW